MGRCTGGFWFNEGLCWFHAHAHSFSNAHVYADPFASDGDTSYTIPFRCSNTDGLAHDYPSASRFRGNIFLADHLGVLDSYKLCFTRGYT